MQMSASENREHAAPGTAQKCILYTFTLRATFETKSADVIVKEIVRVEKFALCMKMKPGRKEWWQRMSACDYRVCA